MISDIGKYYVYRHVRLDDGTVFYIGKGVKPKKFSCKSMEYRRAFSRLNRNKHWENITNNIGYSVDILVESNDINFITEKEKEFISLYGRRDLGKGSLVNFTDGGEGALGRKLTKEHIEKIILANKSRAGIPRSKETKEKISRANKGKVSNRRGKKHKEESKIKMSQSAKNRIAKNGSPWLGRKHKKSSKRKMGTAVLQLDREGNHLEWFDTITEAAEFTGSDFRLISAVCMGKRKTHNGFKWKYAENSSSIKSQVTP